MKRYLPIALLVVAGCTVSEPVVVYVTPSPAAFVAATPEATAVPTAEITPEPTPEVTPEPVSYEALTFKASTDKTTKPFRIDTYGATMTLSVSGSRSACEYALASAYLFPKGEKIMYVGNLSNEKCKTTEETEVYLEPGDYYVEWLIANIQGTLTITPHD